MKKVHSILVAVSISLAMALTSSCSDSGGGGGIEVEEYASLSGNTLLLNFTSDMYLNGVLRWMNTNAAGFLNNPQTDSLMGFNQDSKVFANNGKIFILERPAASGGPSAGMNGGILNCLNPPSTSSSSSKPTPYGYSPQNLGSGSNPYDIAFIDNTGYIALYGTNSVQIFDADSCKLLGNIQLPSTFPVQYSSSSVTATANAASIKVTGDTLLVVIQTWKSYPSIATNGILLRINATTKQIIDTIPLTYYNPQSSILHGDTLYIGSAWDLTDTIYGGFGIDTTKSGVEFVALSNKKDSILVSGFTLNAGVTSMALDNTNGLLYMAVYNSWGTVPVYYISNNSPVQVQGIQEATCMVYDDNTGKLFIGNGTAYSPTVTDPSLMVYTGLGSATLVNNSDYPTNAFPPYSLAIVRY